MSSSILKLGSTLFIGVLLGYFSIGRQTNEFKNDALNSLASTHPPPQTHAGGNSEKSIFLPGQSKQVESSDDKPLLSSDSQLEDIILYLTSRVQEDNYSGFRDRKLRQLLADNPQLILDIFNSLSEIGNESIKNSLTTTLFLSSKRTKLALENALSGKLKEGVDVVKWAEISSATSISNEEIVSLFNAQLISHIEPDDITEIIKAIARPQGGNPKLLNPQNRRETTENLGQYLNSPSAKVRAAAIGTFGTYPPDDLENKLLSALSDSSARVRSAATQSALELLPSSTKLINQLIFSIEDPTTSALARQQTAFLLSRLPLSTSDAAKVARIGQEIEDYFKSMTEQQTNEYLDAQRKLAEKDI